MKNKADINYSLLSKYRVELMGLAAIFIMAFHSHTAFSNGNYNAYFQTIIHQLNIGVEIFLIVSGIGLYFSLSKDNFNFKQYFTKRLLNVYLIYLIISFPLILFNNIAFGGSFTDFILDWTGIAFYMGKRYVFENHGGWYVMLIMPLYAIYPLIYKAQKYLEKKKADLIAVILFTVFHIFLCYYLSVTQPDIYNNYEVAFTRIPVFIIGSYMGKLVYNKNKISAGGYITTVSGIIVFLITYKMPIKFILPRFNKLLLSISICLIFVIIMYMINSKTIENILSFFGKMSLELYLTHNLINELLFKEGLCHNIKQYILIIIISIPISYLISKLRVLIISKYQKKIQS